MSRKNRTLALMIGGALVSANSSPKDDDRYGFETVMVPIVSSVDKSFDEKHQRWVEGILLPSRIVYLNSALALNETLEVAQDEAIGLAISDTIIGCTVNQIMRFRLGQSHVCFVDTDANGEFDHWFRRGTAVVIAGSFHKIPSKEFRKIEPRAYSELSREQFHKVRSETGFSLSSGFGFLAICRTFRGEVESFCTRRGRELNWTDQFQRAEFIEWNFEYRLEGEQRRVRSLAPLKIQTLRTGNI